MPFFSFCFNVICSFQFARTVISADKLEELQENLIRSHSAGVGQPLSVERVRMLMALRINTLAKGYSGISLKTLNQVISAFNSSCLPWIPEQGTVGASGDLAPLSHLALGMLGEGKVGQNSSTILGNMQICSRFFPYADSKVLRKPTTYETVGLFPPPPLFARLTTWREMSRLRISNTRSMP